jgi:hypothetical protein
MSSGCLSISLTFTHHLLLPLLFSLLFSIIALLHDTLYDVSALIHKRMIDCVLLELGELNALHMPLSPVVGLDLLVFETRFLHLISQ